MSYGILREVGIIIFIGDSVFNVSTVVGSLEEEESL